MTSRRTVVKVVATGRSYRRDEATLGGGRLTRHQGDGWLETVSETFIERSAPL